MDLVHLSFSICICDGDINHWLPAEEDVIGSHLWKASAREIIIIIHGRKAAILKISHLIGFPLELRHVRNFDAIFDEYVYFSAYAYYLNKVGEAKGMESTS